MVLFQRLCFSGVWWQFISSRLRLSLGSSCSRGSSFHRDWGLGPPAAKCALYPACSQLLQRVSTDFGPTTPLTLHTSWTVQEVIAAELRILGGSRLGCVVCLVFALGCVFYMLGSVGDDSALLRVALLGHWSPAFSLCVYWRLSACLRRV